MSVWVRDVRVFLEVIGKTVYPVVVFGERREFVRRVHRKAFAVVDDFGGVFGVDALFGQREFRQMDVEKFGTTPRDLEFREDEREFSKRDDRFRSKQRIALRLGVDHVFQHGFPMGVPQSPVKDVDDRVGNPRPPVQSAVFRSGKLGRRNRVEVEKRELRERNALRLWRFTSGIV